MVETMANAFQRYRIWPVDHVEESGVYAFGRNAIEAAQEAFLSFVELDDPPVSIRLQCRSERDCGAIEIVTVEPAFQRPFATADAQPEFAW